MFSLEMEFACRRDLSPFLSAAGKTGDMLRAG
jgi:hypothetical protein